MVKLRLSSTARRELSQLLDYGIDEFGLARATEYYFSFNEKFDLLRRHPEAGRARPDLGPELRSLTHGRHLIIYRINSNEIIVGRILHQSRDLPRHIN